MASLRHFILEKYKYIQRVETFIKRLFIRHAHTFSFLKVIVVNPRRTGALFPSSKRLASEMARHVLLSANSEVIELGPGNGIITEALIERGISPRNITAIEYSPELVQNLCQRFPDISVIEGDAACLIDLLNHTKNRQISTIISSLPLRILPKKKAKAILRQIEMLLPPGGRYIQFTYRYDENRFGRLEGYKKIYSKRIWLNIPPARVDVFVAPSKHI